MARYIATVEYDAGEYWISFPGIQKAGSHAKRPEDIVPHARSFLEGWTKYGATPVSLDDALSEPIAPFEGVRLVVFEWGPPAHTGLRVCGYDREELVLDVRVPVEKLDLARALAQVPDTDPELLGGYPLTGEQANQIVSVPPGFAYVLEADR